MVEKQIKNTEEIRNIEVCSKFDHLIMQIINEVLEEHESDKVSFEIVRGRRKEFPIAQSPSKMQNTLRECYVHFAVLSECFRDIVQCKLHIEQPLNIYTNNTWSHFLSVYIYCYTVPPTWVNKENLMTQLPYYSLPPPLQPYCFFYFYIVIVNQCCNVCPLQINQDELLLLE